MIEVIKILRKKKYLTLEKEEIVNTLNNSKESYKS